MITPGMETMTIQGIVIKERGVAILVLGAAAHWMVRQLKAPIQSSTSITFRRSSKFLPR